MSSEERMGCTGKNETILLRLIADWPTSRFICKLIEDVNHRVSKVVALEQETKGHR